MKNKLLFISILFILIFLFTYLAFHFIRYIPFSQVREIREMILSVKFFPSFIFFLSQIIQILLPIIPGNVVNFAGGYIFGTLRGSILSILGVICGSFLAFTISRYFGRRVLNLFIKKERMKRFDGRIKKKVPLVFFLLLLIPNPLGDIVYFLYGLTNLPLSFFLIAVILSRSPGIIFSSYLGTKALNFTPVEWLIFGLITFTLAALFYLFKEKILQLKIFRF